MKRATAITGVSDHAGWAVLMTIAADGAVLDRRRVELLDPGLPCLAYHHDAQGLPTADAIALIERVAASAARHARAALDALAGAIGAPIAGVALRRCPPLPATIPERMADYRAQNVADTVMIRHALADAAAAKRWRVSWYDPRAVLAGRDAALRAAGAALGPPWTKDQRLAMAAALAALTS